MSTKENRLAFLGQKRINVSRIVQGVISRPFVYELANELGFSGFIPSAESEIAIKFEGSRQILEPSDFRFQSMVPASLADSVVVVRC